MSKSITLPAVNVPELGAINVFVTVVVEECNRERTVFICIKPTLLSDNLFAGIISK